MTECINYNVELYKVRQACNGGCGMVGIHMDV